MRTYVELLSPWGRRLAIVQNRKGAAVDVEASGSIGHGRLLDDDRQPCGSRAIDVGGPGSKAELIVDRMILVTGDMLTLLSPVEIGR